MPTNHSCAPRGTTEPLPCPLANQPRDSLLLARGCSASCRSFCLRSLGFWLGLRPHGHPADLSSPLPDAAPWLLPLHTEGIRGERGTAPVEPGASELSCVVPRAGRAPHWGLLGPGRSFSPSQPSQSLWSFLCPAVFDASPHPQGRPCPPLPSWGTRLPPFLSALCSAKPPRAKSSGRG